MDKYYLLIVLSLVAALGTILGYLIIPEIKEKKEKIVACVVLGALFCAVAGSLVGHESVRAVSQENYITCNKCMSEYKLFNVKHNKLTGNVYYYECSNGHTLKTHKDINR